MGVVLIDRKVQVIAALKQQVANGINNAIAYWVEQAQSYAPIDTSFLHDHIGMTKAASPNDLTGEIRSLAPYSGWVNYGTSKQAAQPFWTVAALQTREKFPDFIYGRGTSAGSDIIKAALMDFHGPMGRKGQGF